MEPIATATPIGDGEAGALYQRISVSGIDGVETVDSKTKICSEGSLSEKTGRGSSFERDTLPASTSSIDMFSPHAKPDKRDWATIISLYDDVDWSQQGFSSTRSGRLARIAMEPESPRDNDGMKPYIKDLRHTCTPSSGSPSIALNIASGATSSNCAKLSTQERDDLLRQLNSSIQVDVKQAVNSAMKEALGSIKHTSALDNTLILGTDVRQWSMDDVDAWLRAQNHHVSSFIYKNDVTGAKLVELTEDACEILGLDIQRRRRLLELRDAVLQKGTVIAVPRTEQPVAIHSSSATHVPGKSARAGDSFSPSCSSEACVASSALGTRAGERRTTHSHRPSARDESFYASHTATAYHSSYGRTVAGAESFPLISTQWVSPSQSVSRVAFQPVLPSPPSILSSPLGYPHSRPSTIRNFKPVLPTGYMPLKPETAQHASLFAWSTYPQARTLAMPNTFFQSHVAPITGQSVVRPQQTTGQSVLPPQQTTGQSFVLPEQITGQSIVPPNIVYDDDVPARSPADPSPLAGWEDAPQIVSTSRRCKFEADCASNAASSRAMSPDCSAAQEQNNSVDRSVLLEQINMPDSSMVQGQNHSLNHPAVKRQSVTKESGLASSPSLREQKTVSLASAWAPPSAQSPASKATGNETHTHKSLPSKDSKVASMKQRFERPARQLQKSCSSSSIFPPAVTSLAQSTLPRFDRPNSKLSANSSATTLPAAPDRDPGPGSVLQWKPTSVKITILPQRVQRTQHIAASSTEHGQRVVSNVITTYRPPIMPIHEESNFTSDLRQDPNLAANRAVSQFKNSANANDVPSDFRKRPSDYSTCLRLPVSFSTPHTESLATTTHLQSRSVSSSTGPNANPNPSLNLDLDVNPNLSPDSSSNTKQSPSASSYARPDAIATTPLKTRNIVLEHKILDSYSPSSARVCIDQESMIMDPWCFLHHCNTRSLDAAQGGEKSKGKVISL